MLITVVPEDVYKLLPAKGIITDKMLRDAYAGEPGALVTGNYHETFWMGTLKVGICVEIKSGALMRPAFYVVKL